MTLKLNPLIEVKSKEGCAEKVRKQQCTMQSYIGINQSFCPPGEQAVANCLDIHFVV